jgi:hypothetical protein
LENRMTAGIFGLRTYLVGYLDLQLLACKSVCEMLWCAVSRHREAFARGLSHAWFRCSLTVSWEVGTYPQKTYNKNL